MKSVRIASSIMKLKCTPQVSTASQSTYRAVVCTELGKPLTIQNIPKAKVPDGHVRIAVHCAGLNFADILLVQGKYQEKPPLPFTPGSEWAGRVLETASDVTDFKVGDRVLGLAMNASSGTFAEEVITPSYFVWPLPSTASFAQGAGLITVYSTAYGALTRKAQIQEGETVLVTAAAGATGMACVDLAANVFKCKVIAACGSDEKCALVKSKGAWQTVNYRTEDLRSKVKELTDGEGVNVIVDMVGGSMWDKCMRCIAFEGRMVVIGFASGDIPKMATNYLLMKSATAVGFFWGNFGARGHPFFMQSIEDISQLLAEEKIHPTVSDGFSLEQINDALQFVQDRKSVGKVVVNCRT